MATKLLNIADIVVRTEDRLRPLDRAHVDLLADSMTRQKAAGLPAQIAPIEVSRAGERYILVAGWHRLEAAKKAGLQTIEARVVEGAAPELRLREIEENLCRYDLKALDRSFFVQEWFELQGGLDDPKTKAKTEKTLSEQCWAKLAQRGFSEQAAERAGLGSRTIRRDLQLANALRSVRRQLAGLPIASNQSELLRLARLKAEQRPAVIAELKAGKTFSEATASKAKANIKGATKLGVLKAAWDKASVDDQDQFLRERIQKLSAKRRAALCLWLADRGLLTEA
ncbi:MAG: ParB/RepB/Spo0J family partition protein [Proteobacteria bacterium]|nr:ParB/RepB/Spo0J family partition protein [Pseudomonadota bacterium]